MNNAKLSIAIILGIIGLFYVALPHSVHVDSGLGFGLAHTAHIAIGFVFIIAAIIAFIAARK